MSLQILLPLFSNKYNNVQWPQVVSEDIIRHIRNLKSGVYVLSGQVKGKTLLPLPVGMEKVNDNAINSNEK